MFLKFPCYNISFSCLNANRKNLLVKDMSTLKYRFAHVNCFCTLHVHEIKYSFTRPKKQNHNDMHKQTLNKRK